MQRRQFLGVIGLFATPFELFAASRKPTPQDVEGPFYPVVRIPVRSNLINSNSGLIGQPLALSGRVLDRTGAPLPGTKVEIWQCDGRGLYDHPLQDRQEDFDANFAGFGAQVTDAQGFYQFTTLFPVPYTGRPPHIHVKLLQNDETLLTTQLYLEGKTGSSWFGSRDALQIEPTKTNEGGMQAEFTFVV